jgi:hypothetical protein
MLPISMDVPPQYFQWIIALELAVTGALLGGLVSVRA